MSPENCNSLNNAFPKIFSRSNASGSGPHYPFTLFSFEHGDGWYNIIERLCANTQHHIDWQRKQRASALRFNRVLTRALERNDDAGLVNYFTFKGQVPSDYTARQVAEAKERREYREVPDKVAQVVVDQVKEKFGTLRFYYHGGDEYIDGMVRMAEAMTEFTCEKCGAPAKTEARGGWVSTICPKCRRAINKQRKAVEHDQV